MRLAATDAAALAFGVGGPALLVLFGRVRPAPTLARWVAGLAFCLAGWEWWWTAAPPPVRDWCAPAAQNYEARAAACGLAAATAPQWLHALANGCFDAGMAVLLLVAAERLATPGSLPWAAAAAAGGVAQNACLDWLDVFPKHCCRPAAGGPPGECGLSWAPLPPCQRCPAGARVCWATQAYWGVVPVAVWALARAAGGRRGRGGGRRRLTPAPPASPPSPGPASPRPP
jgi:hypothetical protein